MLDESAIRVIEKDFRAGPVLEDEAFTTLYQGSPEVWKDSFLAQTEAGLLRISTSGGELTSKTLLEGEALTVEPWGDSFLVFLEQASEVFVLTPAAEIKVLPQGALSSLEVVDSDLALLRTGKSLFALRAAEPPTLEEVKLPFPTAQAKTSVSGGRAVAWSSDSDQLVDLVSGTVTKLGEKPSFGVRGLEDGSVVAAGAQWLTLLRRDGEQRQFPRPVNTTEELLAEWQIFTAGNQFQVVSLKDDRAQVLHYGPRGSTSADLLAEGKVHATLFPAEGQAGRGLLFLETSFEEPKFDDEGRAVLELMAATAVGDEGKADRPAMLTVKGHRIYELEAGGSWKQIVDLPRAALVGPVERVGDRVVYATQTEPPHHEGQELDLDARYPYPAVILHGRSFSDPQDLWSFEKPRGETLAKGRVPEEGWPLLSETGPLLITSEDSRLLAIDPATGQLQWSSGHLPIDESSPLMLQWRDAFGLVATKSTGRTLLFVDPKTGSTSSTVTLNKFFIREQWRHLISLLVVCFALAYYIYMAGKRTLYIRQIAGLKALDEAVGRATEMGKPVLYVVGLADVDDIQTMASLSILSHVARKTAEYDTPIITTTARAVVYSTAHEIVRDAFSLAGRPDAFSAESVRYISDDQFGYTAGVDGIMVREKPAANFYIGTFYAESLILAETGFATGSIQIAGTATASQVPFFVAACDYTLIGEELYAASAYLSRDPLQVGSLRGQDVGKMIVMVLLVVCSLLVSFGIDWTTISEWTGYNLP